MAVMLTKDQFKEILQDSSITKQMDIQLFQTLYSFDGHKYCAGELGRHMGFLGMNPSAPLNSEIGRYAKRIAQKYDIEYSVRIKQKYKFWDLFFNGWVENKHFVWQLKPNLVAAIEELQMLGEVDEPTEIPRDFASVLTEGAKRSIIVNAYERNQRARKLCIEHHGCSCVVCNFNFYREYGEIGANYIHVHHLIPLSLIGKDYVVNPIADLVPVCPNCHAMLHNDENLLTIEDLRTRILNAKGKK
jgi:5-methylcytosine-specific restriction protein A